jgi:hypothetical protein
MPSRRDAKATKKGDGLKKRGDCGEEKKATDGTDEHR